MSDIEDDFSVDEEFESPRSTTHSVIESGVRTVFGGQHDLVRADVIAKFRDFLSHTLLGMEEAVGGVQQELEVVQRKYDMLHQTHQEQEAENNELRERCDELCQRASSEDDARRQEELRQELQETRRQLSQLREQHVQAVQARDIAEARLKTEQQRVTTLSTQCEKLKQQHRLSDEASAQWKKLAEQRDEEIESLHQLQRDGFATPPPRRMTVSDPRRTQSERKSLHFDDEEDKLVTPSPSSENAAVDWTVVARDVADLVTSTLTSTLTSQLTSQVTDKINADLTSRLTSQLDTGRLAPTVAAHLQTAIADSLTDSLDAKLDVKLDRLVTRLQQTELAKRTPETQMIAAGSPRDIVVVTPSATQDTRFSLQSVLSFLLSPAPLLLLLVLLLVLQHSNLSWTATKQPDRALHYTVSPFF